jgi:hypothetical protein
VVDRRTRSDYDPAMTVGCEKPTTRGRCDVVATGRCIDCGDAFCPSHQASTYYATLSNLCTACQSLRREVEEAPRRAASAVQADAAARILTTAKSLAVTGRSRLVQRRRLVTRERVLLRMVEWWDELEPAWPVGEQPWHFGETATSGDGTHSIPTGVTPSGRIVPLRSAHAGEKVLNTTPDRPLPRYARLGQDSHLPEHHEIKDLRGVAGRLESLHSQVNH